MQHSEAATHRFYAAFYQWSVRSANPTRRCAGINNAIVARRRASSTRQMNDDNEKTITSRESFARPLPKTWMTPKAREERLRSDPVQSTIDLPVGSLEVWNLAIRERTNNSVTLELQVPKWVLKDDRVLRQAEGQVRVGVQKDLSIENRLNSPVLLSGRFRHVNRVWQDMINIGFSLENQQTGLNEAEEVEPATITSGGPQSKPSGSHQAGLEEPGETQLTTSTPWKLQSELSERHDAQALVIHELRLPTKLWKSLAENSAVDYYRQEFQVEVIAYQSGHVWTVKIAGRKEQVKRAAQDLQRATSMSSSEQNELFMWMRFWSSEQAQVVTVADRAPDQLDLWETVVRMRRFEDMSLELCLPKYIWKILAQNGVVDYFNIRYSVRVEQGEIHLANQCVRLHGEAVKVRLAVRFFDKFKPDDTREPVWALASRMQSYLRRQRDTQNIVGQDSDQNMAQVERGRESTPQPVSVKNFGGAIVAEDEAQSMPAVERMKDAPVDHAPRNSLAAGSITNATITTPSEDAAATKQHNGHIEKQLDKDSQRQLGDDMRSALRHLTQPVALVVATMPGLAQKPVDLRPRGVTVSSFCTVTLSPVPIISFNLRVPSRSWDAISAAGRLSVILPSASPQGAAAAHTFTLPYEQPHEPFERLEKLGAGVYLRSKDRNVPARLRWKNAFIADMTAKLLPDKCIQVGDHMVVLAEIQRIKWLEESDGGFEDGALAYGRKGYRRLGEEVKPVERNLEAPDLTNLASSEAKPVQANVPVTESQHEKTVLKTSTASDSLSKTPSQGRPAEAKEEAKRAETSAETEKRSLEEDNLETYGNEEGMNDLLERFAAAGEETSSLPESKASHQAADSTVQQAQADPRDISDLGPSSPLLDDDSLRQVLNESETSYASEGLPSQAAGQNPALAEALNAVAGAYKVAPNDTTASESPSTPRQSASPTSHPPKTGHLPWGPRDTNKSTNRSFSSWTSMYKRMYSTSSDKPDPPISDKILKTTVGEYLCEAPQHRKRYVALINTRRRTDRLQRQLELGDWTPEKATKMEDEILVARDHIAVELATRNAHDLRAMLDLGRVNPARAQWLESNLEAGQAVLLAEAKSLRTAVYQGRLSAEEFEEKKAKITQDYEEIDTQLMRLKDFVDEDEFDGDGIGGGGEWDGDQDESSSGKARGES